MKKCIEDMSLFPIKISLLIARWFWIVSGAVSLLLVSSVARGAVITVNTDTSGGGCTIMDAIDSANADSALGGCLVSTTGSFGDDSIILPPGNNIETLFAVDNTAAFGPNGLPVISSKISIEGNNGLIGRFSAPATPLFRLFYVTTGGDLTLKDVRLQGGQADDGNPGASSTNDYGSAIFNYGGTVTLDNCTVTGNTSGDSIGGATVFSQSTGSFGARLTVTETTISENIGGGITSTLQGAVTVDSILTVRDSSVSLNTGFGLNLISGTAQVARSEISGNSFGGMRTGNDVALTVRDSTISANSTTSSGGGLSIIVGSGSPVIWLINDTISGNTAVEGGGIMQALGTLNLVNTLVSGNHTLPASGPGHEIRRDGGGGGAGVQLNNLLGDDSVTTAQALSGFTADASDIIAASDGTRPTPLSQIVGPLIRNGGMTKTQALPQGSPALNAAVTTYSTGGLFAGEGCAYVSFLTSKTVYRNDQRGVSRPRKNRCDIGAFERKTSFYVIPLPGDKTVVFGL